MSPSEFQLPHGRVIEDTVVPARAPWSARVARGNILRLIDLEGQQAVDFLCFNADDPSERYHAANTIKVPCNIYVGEGTVLRSSLARPMMTVVADTCGRHDTIFGCCSFEIDEVRYGKTNAECCQRNFERELAKHGVGPEHIVPNVNFFMYVPIG
ncbi:MAG: urea carboxylase-associated family protein, partial [Alphaproteobacteria bacterium]|nr:urea carboxylase-associated family protein [Alphaproteobacteria bacterium]